MLNKATLRKTTDAAIFSRNYLDNLEAAAARNKKNPEKKTTFRSERIWRTALHLLQIRKTLPVYFVPKGGKGYVEFAATLHHVKLNPEQRDSYLKWALADSEVKGAGKEGLWEKHGKKIKTLYVITHCKRIEPFPFTELIKVSDGTSVSPNFKYSYSVVHQHTQAPGDDLIQGPDEIPEPKLYSEGISRTVSVNVFERSKAARQKCIEHHGLDCFVCGFNFEKSYGEAGAGIIHVHHIKSLAEIDRTYKVDPVRDLRPVCPNCHAVIHSSEIPLSIEKARSIVKN